MNARIDTGNEAFSAAELATAESRASATPMMEQYIEIKANNPGSLLFYRMGDFYELFFEDALEASRALGITLTKRGQHMGQDIPMCGVPVHAADDYLQKLISLGFRVAVCEQVEDPAEAKNAAENPSSSATSCASSLPARSPRRSCFRPRNPTI